ncbi:coth protein-domain-containing protein [Mucor mucedo]|uniref:coth protein-domain-containing protein n=1 Tax=Mucor mucedo TaxID=29922 RepID=UPI00221EAF50|nr:coth protein-domain-containing protein [Mucor mucedo]KAI7892103.1 coth protein-domain-containing protein [Mucor mucedo]
MKSLSFIALTVLTAVNAASVTFKVIAPECNTDVQVDINGQLTKLTASDPDVPYYTGTAELADDATYKYVVDGTAEDCTRSLEEGSSTRNEFYNRPITYADIPELPSILTNGSWTRGATSHPIWDSNYIPSVFVTANEEEMENLILNVPKDVYSAKITVIGPDEVNTFENCTVNLHRPGRKNNDAKQSWVYTLPEGQLLASRSTFKLRHQEEDPTQIREKLYADISRKMGTYANEANMVRLFVNKEGMGTFNMLDDVIKYSYIDAMFNNGTESTEMGGLFDGGSGATFDPADGYYSFTPNEESPFAQEDIEPFATKFEAVDFSNDAQVQAIADYFDYDQFLRFMVIEFLTGDWDGYWMEQTNIGAYIAADENDKMYFLAQDFDATFGVNLAYEDDFVELPYTDYPTKFPKAVLINKLLENPTVKSTFESYLRTTVIEIFNNATLGNYVNARHEFIYPDLEWDRSIKQRSPGNIFGWTAEQTTQNLVEGVTAPGASTGGAAFGILEWVSEKEAAVKAALSISDDEISKPAAKTEPVAKVEPVAKTEPVTQTPAVTEDETAEEDTTDEDVNEDLSGSSIKAASVEQVDSAANGKYIPQVLSTLAIVGAVTALL